MSLVGFETKSEIPCNSEEFLIPAAITDAGCERDLNEDRYAVVECSSGIAWFVCDGMGGAAGGELAAQLAIDAMRRDLENLPTRPPGIALESAILEANRVIVLRRQNQAFAQMGTTVVGALFRGEEVAVAHVGDSRAYVIRNREIQQLTRDHTLVQELVDNGQLRAQDALSHPQAHILTRCVGAEPSMQMDVKTYWIWQINPGEPLDALLLCSDGLYSLVGEDEIADLISTRPPHTACVELAEIAKQRGGFDNITLAIVPLGGQLKEQPPVAGMGLKRSVRKKGRLSLNFISKDFLKTGLFAGILTIISVLIVLCLIIYSIGQ